MYKTIADMCAHLQNCTLRRLTVVSVPQTKYNLALAKQLCRQGFITNVQQGSHEGPDELNLPNSSEDVKNRRIWIQMKYRENEPVIHSISPTSTKNKRISLKWPEVQKICTGSSVSQKKGIVRPLTMGECLFIKTDLGIMEAREAIQQRKGGLCICRVK